MLLGWCDWRWNIFHSSPYRRVELTHPSLRPAHPGPTFISPLAHCSRQQFSSDPRQQMSVPGRGTGRLWGDVFGWGRRILSRRGGSVQNWACRTCGHDRQDEICNQVGDDHTRQLWSKLVQVWSKLGGGGSDFRHGISGYPRYPGFWIPILFFSYAKFF